MALENRLSGYPAPPPARIVKFRPPLFLCYYFSATERPDRTPAGAGPRRTSRHPWPRARAARPRRRTQRPDRGPRRRPASATGRGSRTRASRAAESRPRRRPPQGAARRRRSPPAAPPPCPSRRGRL